MNPESPSPQQAGTLEGPMFYAFKHNRGNGKIGWTFHEPHEYATAYRDTCLEIIPLVRWAAPEAPVAQVDVLEAEDYAEPEPLTEEQAAEYAADPALALRSIKVTAEDAVVSGDEPMLLWALQDIAQVAAAFVNAAAPLPSPQPVTRVAVDLLREVVAPLEVSAAVIEDEDGGEAIEELIDRVKRCVEQFDRNAMKGQP